MSLMSDDSVDWSSQPFFAFPHTEKLHGFRHTGEGTLQASLVID